MRPRWGVAVAAVAALVVTSCSSDTSEQQPSANGDPSLKVPEGVRDLQAIHVEASGLQDGHFTVGQCVESEVLRPGDGSEAPKLDQACDLTLGSAITAKASGGSFKVQFQVRAFIGVGQRREVDCTETECVVALVDGNDSVIASAPVEWAEDPAVRPAPVLTIEHIAWGTKRGRARIVGSGFPPGVAVALTQCPPYPDSKSGLPSVSAGDCLYDQTSVATADKGGQVADIAIVFPRFETSDGVLIDCRAAAPDCLLAVPWPTDSAYRMTAATFPG